jgi:hypothetical protein
VGKCNESRLTSSGTRFDHVDMSMDRMEMPPHREDRVVERFCIGAGSSGDPHNARRLRAPYDLLQSFSNIIGHGRDYVAPVS